MADSSFDDEVIRYSISMYLSDHGKFLLVVCPLADETCNAIGSLKRKAVGE